MDRTSKTYVQELRLVNSLFMWAFLDLNYLFLRMSLFLLAQGGYLSHRFIHCFQKTKEGH